MSKIPIKLSLTLLENVKKQLSAHSKKIWENYSYQLELSTCFYNSIKAMIDVASKNLSYKEILRQRRGEAHVSSQKMLIDEINWSYDCFFADEGGLQ